MPLIQFRQPSVEVVAHEQDSDVGGALDDAHAQFAQRRVEFQLPFHVECSYARTTLLKISLRGLRLQPQACPICGDSAARGRSRRDHITAVDKPLQRFLDLGGRKIMFEPANELSNGSSALRYRAGERAIEFTVKQEFPVLRIEAHCVGGHQIDREMRRELQNRLVSQGKAVCVTAGHGSIRAP